MARFDWVFFDADETLFSFDSFRGLQLLLADYGVGFNAQDFAQYQQLNKPLWAQYNQGQITAAQLQTTRFAELAAKLRVSAEALNHQFLLKMAEICQPLPGVVEMLECLRAHDVKLGIITNGFTALQQLRLERTGLAHHFAFVAISEQVGVAKPHKGIFDYALTQAGVRDKSAVLMVGDSLETDIQGAMNAGLSCCWFNPKAVQNEVYPLTFEIRAMDELVSIVMDKSAV
ncbi:pyrimidine 5'-nucleotidase [Pasteurellaceae bacterium HPA106]|uniref:pyrimidine 5'-nucleotidase n=1 Tax=Spirabiliibacterium pneumoniae TaxID=221400 RepID=UPI001AAD4398|nr:pyrimidine 5'-nucleotidase [Spirabiliibacterium pneumoniae]MBE2895933.1 pyrimidine 5'-nucleotidase [Spirabiliibacterium pneumoniae]